jgi:hypothetical protein
VATEKRCHSSRPMGGRDVKCLPSIRGWRGLHRLNRTKRLSGDACTLHSRPSIVQLWQRHDERNWAVIRPLDCRDGLAESEKTLTAGEMD